VGNIARMSGKQAEKARAKKAQRRKKQVAERKREVARRASLPADIGVELDDYNDYEIGPDDYLPSGKVKASAALLYLAQPFVQLIGAHSGKGFEMVMMLTLVGWNLAVRPDKEAQFRSLVMGSMHEMPPEIRKVVEGIIDVARQAKLEYFPDDDRIFASVHVEHRPEGPYITVQSMDPDLQPTPELSAKVRGR